MILLTLKAITHKGKNRIREWGDTWQVKDIVSNRLLITSFIDKTERQQSLRWIDSKNDSDFMIVATQSVTS